MCHVTKCVLATRHIRDRFQTRTPQHSQGGMGGTNPLTLHAGKHNINILAATKSFLQSAGPRRWLHRHGLVPSSGWNSPDKTSSGRPETIIRYHFEVVRRRNHASVRKLISAMAYEMGLAALISQQQSQLTRRPQFTSFGTVAAFLQEYENAPPTAAVPSSPPVMQVLLRNNRQKTANFSGPSTHGGCA